MSLSPPNWRQTQHIHRRGTRASQPNADTVTIGTLYFVTDESVIERSNGTTWDSYSVDLDPFITSTVIGGTAAGSDLTLQSTNNGSPSGDEVNVKLQNDYAHKYLRNPSTGGVVDLFGDSTLKYTGLPINTNSMEWHIGTDVNFNVSKSGSFAGPVFQTYNDAFGANIPLEFFALPIIFGGALVYNSYASATLAAGNNNDLNPSGIGYAQTLFVVGDAGGSNLTGIVPTVGGSSYFRMLSVFNFGSTMTIVHNSGASSAANRFLLPSSANITLNQYDSATFLYHYGIPAWLQIK